MADENTQRQMDFIIEQQAQFAARMEQLEELVVRLARSTLGRFEATDERVQDIDVRISALVNSQMRTEETVKRTDERISALVDSQVRTEENVKKTDERISALVDSQVRTQENVKKTDERISALVDSQVRTDENVRKTDESLRGLIAVVDRYLSEGRNGNSKG